MGICMNHNKTIALQNILKLILRVESKIAADAPVTILVYDALIHLRLFLDRHKAGSTGPDHTLCLL